MKARPKKTAAEKAMDHQIEQAYYRLAQGRQICVLQIPALFRESRSLILAGQTVDEAVQASVNKFCEPVTA